MTKLATCLEGGSFNTGNLTVMALEFSKEFGTEVSMHSHPEGHTMFILEGEVLVKTFDPSCGCTREKVFKPFEHCWIPAGVKHGAKGLTDTAKGMCVFIKGKADFQVDKDLNGWGDLGAFNIEKQ